MKHSIIVVVPDMKIEQLVKEIINLAQRQVILEVPEETTFLTNEINLRLIKFYAEDEEKELIINAVDPLLVTLAQRLGISTIRERNLEVARQVEETAAAAAAPLESEAPPAPQPKKAEPKPKPPEAPKGKPKRTSRSRDWSYKGFLPAVIMTLATLALGIWLFLQPKAVVIVYPKEQKLNFGAQVSSGPDYQDKDILTGNIPAKLVEKVAEITVQTTATGEKTIGVAPATGRVVLINRSNQPVVVKSGTLVSNGRMQFKTGKTILVPRKNTRLRYGVPVGEEYGKVQAPIVAVEKGSAGNVPAKSISRIEGPFQKYLQVVNLVPTQGGKDKTVTIVAAEDQKKGQNEANSQMVLVAPEDLAALVGEGYLYLPELVKMEVKTLRSVPKVGAEATTVKTYLKYRAYAIVPSTAGIQKYLLNQLEVNIPPGFEAKNSDVKLVSAQVLKNYSQTTNLHLVGTATLRGILSRMKIEELVKGKTVAAAKAALTRQNEVADFKIETNDPRSKMMPRFGFQIKILFPAGEKNRLE